MLSFEFFFAGTCYSIKPVVYSMHVSNLFPIWLQGPYSWCVVSVSGRVNYSEVAGYPLVQNWRLRSILYHVKLNQWVLSQGISLNYRSIPSLRLKQP